MIRFVQKLATGEVYVPQRIFGTQVVHHACGSCGVREIVVARQNSDGWVPADGWRLLSIQDEANLELLGRPLAVRPVAEEPGGKP